MNRFISLKKKLKNAKIANKITVNKFIKKLKNTNSYKTTIFATKKMINNFKKLSFYNDKSMLICIDYCIDLFNIVIQKHVSVLSKKMIVSFNIKMTIIKNDNNFASKNISDEKTKSDKQFIIF